MLKYSSSIVDSLETDNYIVKDNALLDIDGVLMTMA